MHFYNSFLLYSIFQVRRESLKVLHLVLSNAAVDKVEPFFDFMCTYLRSAMTHIDSRIQEDSLFFLDILLLCTVERVAKDFHKIMPNFIDMISKLRLDSKPGRTLTVNLDSKITSVKWRVKVLHRLQDFLHKFVEYNKATFSAAPIKENSQRFDESKHNFYPLFNTSYTANCYLPLFSNRNSQDSLPVDGIEKFKFYINTLTPLLFETWLEVCPNSSSGKSIETVLTEDTAILLKHTLHVISLIWEIVQELEKKNPSSNIKKLFYEKYRKLFSQHIVTPFPYATNVRTNKLKSTSTSVFEEKITDPKMIVENLEICYLFISINPNVNIKLQKKEISAVLNYIEKIFNENTEDEMNKIIMRILHTIFSNEVTGWTQNVSIMDTLLHKIIWSYFNKTTLSAFHQDIFTLLCKIALNDKLSHFHESDAYDEWIKNLPNILLEPTITEKSIEIIHKFAVCNNKVFNEVIKNKLLNIVNNLPKIKITDSTSDSSNYRKLFSLLYWIKMWDNESLNLMENQLLQNVYEPDHCTFIFDTLRLRSSGVFE